MHYKSGESLSIADAQGTKFEIQYSGDNGKYIKTPKIDSPALLNFITQMEETHGEKQ